ncbi:polyphosphate kinase [Salmonella enterica subsp. enterica]|uniref:Polyphosphate kinase n=1 Tax=Salmonella enterica I TaxID=59201 RepID=A0A447TY61_SALET|nr:polyphosphate kinase [Salmonella enterica subsp. enterica]
MTQSYPAGATTILKTLLIFRMSVKPTWSINRYRGYAIFGFDKEKFRNGFDAIRERDVLLYYPYHTFEHVLELLRQASFDPSVLAIKNQYLSRKRKTRALLTR